MFFLGVSQILLEQLFPIISQSGWFYIKRFYKLTPVFALKNSCYKTFRKIAENLWRIATYHSFQVLPLIFAKFLLIAVFQNIVTGLLLRWLTAYKKKSRKEGVERSSFDNFSIISLTSSSITISLWMKLNLKLRSQSNLKLLPS